MRFIDETGNRYGRLLVVEAVPVKGFGRQWFCACDCGGKIIVKGPHLRNGQTISCGCRGREMLVAGRTTHGMSDLPEYKIWESMKARCMNPRDKAYEDYGGRGIGMHILWRSDFEAFYRDVGPRPTGKHTIERVNNDEGYSPSNCVWATRMVQNNNKRPRGTGGKARRARERLRAMAKG